MTRRTIRIGIAHRGAGVAPIFAALRDGGFEREGIATDLIDLADHADALKALEAGTVDIINSVGPEVLLHNARNHGSAVIVASAISRTAVEIMVPPEWPDDRLLVDARWGVLRRFDPDHLTAVQTFRFENWPIDRLDLKEAPAGKNRLDRLLAPGRFDAVVLHAPDPILARAKGWRAAVDTARYDAPMQNSCAATTKRFVHDERPILQAYLRAYAQGVWRFRYDAAFGRQVLLDTCSGLDASAACEAWLYFARVFGGGIYPSPAGLLSARDILVELGAISKAIALPLDQAPMAELEADGLFGSIAGTGS